MHRIPLESPPALRLIESGPKNGEIRPDPVRQSREPTNVKDLEAANTFLRQIISESPTPLWLKDCGGRFRLYNRAFGELFTIDGDAWHGRTIEEAFPGDFASAESRSDQTLLDHGTDALCYEITLTLGGQTRTLLVDKKQIFDGAAAGILGTITDLTYRQRKERELERLAITDGLTGTFNRRHFFDMAALEWDRGLRYGRSLSAIILDIDHFKEINDVFGHAAGDDALRAVVLACRQTLRENDLLGRLGGEEFAVLLPDADLQRALDVAGRLRQAVRSVTVGDTPVTASFGVAQRQGDPTVEALLSRADRAMYEVKRKGRDGIMGNAESRAPQREPH